MLYTFNPAYTQPNTQGVKNALTKKNGDSYAIPLVVSCSIFMDETAALSDYILPDSTYFERFSLPFTSYPTLKTKAATTGEEYSGIPVWEEPNIGLKGNKPEDAEYEYTMNTYKRAWHVQSRSASNEWLLELQPEGFIYLNSSDASSLGVLTGDTVKVASPNGQSTEGKVRVINGLRR